LNTNEQAAQFLTAQEVSDRYGGRISVRTLNNWRNLGSGPAFTKIGGKVLYPLGKLLEWEQRNTVQSTSEYSRGSAA
jgi:hypothetical protein